MGLEVIADRLAAYDPGSAPPETVEGALVAIALVRTELDQAERRVIASARAGGLTWQRIARALGYASRQAAEQRYLRLTRTCRDRQLSVDRIALVELREAADSLRVQLRNLAPSGPVRLARASLDLAVEAPPGAMHDLVRAALDDLTEVRLDRRIRYAVQRARAALQT